ncbi:MAG: 2-C-methyl-D-erythritol 4-phosphate cytidylyltransferase [Lachnospiraceae bacterium]|nr:2-C-methyl-D-erythritol 4-phosphate cytidylyltransferase [Lachnospiraceae bacterium]
MKTTAIVLAGGRGKRMNSAIPKQFLTIQDKPVLYYSLQAFENSFVDSIILVVSEDDREYCQREIVEKYHFQKVKKIVSGGKERYHSVLNGIKAAEDCDYIFVHDGARPFVSQDMLQRLLDCVKTEHACVAGMPVKDTIKIADESGYIASTPKRDLVWMIQTPQVFSFNLIKKAYLLLEENEYSLLEKGISITDDAMVVETLLGEKVKLVEGSYRNIKITTPEDLTVAEGFLRE